MEETIIALNRFGLGAGIGEVQRIESGSGPALFDALRSQLRPGSARLDSRGLPTLAEAGELLERARRAQQVGRAEGFEAVRRDAEALARREALAVLERRLRTETPFVERLVAFWSNHLCVSIAGRLSVLPLAGLYERQAIRPHVLGRFSSMVLASARHPAMLLYLDNARSIGPGSPGARFLGRRRGEERGLNENYARELLELHTLGVDGGYEQADVEALARILTGWTLAGVGPGARPGTTLGFTFRPEAHEPGAKRLLGRRIRESGAEEGERAILQLSAHPSTARFVAAKLVRHFVADDPPARAVGAIERVFLETGGDLLRVSQALVELPEAWEPASRKFRTPQDWIVAVARAVRLESFPPRLLQVLRALRHPLWAPGSPQGFEDRIDSWADPDSLMNRAELARSVADAVSPRVVDPVRLLSVVDAAPDGPLVRLLADRSIPSNERVALALAAPEFQWR